MRFCRYLNSLKPQLLGSSLRPTNHLLKDNDAETLTHFYVERNEGNVSMGLASVFQNLIELLPTPPASVIADWEYSYQSTAS